MKIKDVEVIWLNVPFRERYRRYMAHTDTYHSWTRFTLFRVTTDNGLAGIGEMMKPYWGYWTTEMPESVVQRVIGRNPFDVMWDDSLTSGLQMALLDVAGKAAGVPIYRLLGEKCRDWVPIAYWALDMPPAEFAEEAKLAVQQGYMSFKQKARPWFDVYEQAALSAAATPADFHLEFDFNEHLGDAPTALRVLGELDRCEKLTLYESPIPNGDLEGYRTIRRHTHRPLATHYGFPPLATPQAAGCFDAFVMDQMGATTMLRRGHNCQEGNVPFWMQLVGTGVTTAMGLHLGAVLTHARFPLVSCLNIYEDPLLAQPLEIRGGYARVPEAPGLGVELNEAALRWRIPNGETHKDKALYAFVRAGGCKTWYASELGKGGYWGDFQAGNQPRFEHGARLERWDDDGSKEWQELAGRLRAGPLREG